MSSFAKAPISGEGDRFEVDVELLVGDDLVSVAALVVGVDVGGGTTVAISPAESSWRGAIPVAILASLFVANIRNDSAAEPGSDSIGPEMGKLAQRK